MNHLAKGTALKPINGSIDTHSSSETPRPLFKDRKSETLILIDGKKLARECFVRSIELSYPGITVRSFFSVDDWLSSSSADGSSAILVNISSRSVSDPDVGAEIGRVVEEAKHVPVIVLADSEDLRELIAALDRGARGYIPASVGIDAIVEAARLASTGGMFLPAESVLSLRHMITKVAPSTGIEEHFTTRQSAVANALRLGKANKVIAYQLNMSESTVKVHIRNIMKKLHATNRTEAAFKLNTLCETGGFAESD